MQMVCEKVDSEEITAKEGSILLKWLDSKVKVKPEGKNKLVTIMVSIRKLMDAPLDSIDSTGIMRAVSRIESETESKNYRQKRLTTLKNFCEFRHFYGLKFDNYEFMMRKIKPGTADTRAKTETDLVSLDQFVGIFDQCALTTEERAMILLMWDGCLRPRAVLTLRWNQFTTVINEEGETTRQYWITFKTEKPRLIVMDVNTVNALELYRDEIKANWESGELVFKKSNGEPYRSTRRLTELFSRIKAEMGFSVFKPSTIRNSALTEDANTHDLHYVSLRGWGDHLNPMVNTYVRSDSQKIQLKAKRQKINTIPKVLSAGIGDVGQVVEILNILKDNPNVLDILRNLPKNQTSQTS